MLLMVVPHCTAAAVPCASLPASVHLALPHKHACCPGISSLAAALPCLCVPADLHAAAPRGAAVRQLLGRGHPPHRHLHLDHAGAGLQPVLAACSLWLAAIAGGAEQAQPAGTALVPAFNLKRKTSCCCALFLCLQLGGWQLDRPMELGWSRCRPDNPKGPCAPQAPGVLSLGGIIYGNFNL